MPNLVRLDALRNAAKARADREGDDDTLGFLAKAEWNALINASWQKLYSLLVTRFQDQYAKSVQFGISNTTDTYSWATIGAQDFFKGLGVDLMVNGLPVPLKRFNFAERGMGNPLAPLALTVPGLYPLQYQLRGDAVVFLKPVPSGTAQLWYIPAATLLVNDSDTIDDVNGFGEFVVVDAAIAAKTKEDSDTSALVVERGMLDQRIIEAASSRDAGTPSTISDTSEYSGGWW